MPKIYSIILMEFFHWLWFPQKDYSHVVYLVFSPIFFAVIILLPSFVNVKYIGIVAECVFITPLVTAAVIAIRYAQTCSISQGIRATYSKLNMGTKKRIGIIGVLGAISSLAAINLFSNNLSQIFIGLLSIFSGCCLSSASTYSKKFLIIGILYLALYFLFTIFYFNFSTIVFIFFFATLLLPSFIAEGFLFKRVQMEDQRQK